MKKYLTMWQAWAGLALILAVLLLVNKYDLRGSWLFVLLLICPLMMVFMMGSHKDHKH